MNENKINVSKLGDDLNGLMKDHRDALQLLFDAGRLDGFKQGVVTGVVLSGLVAATVGLGVLSSKLTIKILENIEKKKHKKEEP